MRFIYLASASNGNRVLLRNVVKQFVHKYFVFAPCLGFNGLETPEIRPLIMGVCLDALQWCHALIILYEGIKSEGIWEELSFAVSRKIPSCIVETGNLILPKIKEIYQIKIFTEVSEVKEWLSEL